MSESVRELAAMIVRQGHVVLPHRDHLLVYGWTDWEEDKHKRTCEVTADGEPWGIHWSEFEDTYSENSEHDGVEVKVTCACGKLNGRVIRWEARMSEIMGSVPEDVAEERRW